MEFQASLHSLNGFDYAVILILLLSGLLALVRGFVREVLSLAALAGAFYVAAHFYVKAEPYLHSYVTNKNMLSITSCLVVFFAAWLLFVLIGFLIARFLVQGRALNMIDRSLGFGFGLARGLLVLSIIYLAASSTLWPELDKTPEQVQEQQAQLPVPMTPGEQKQAKENKDVPPPWLMKAKTRPALVYGAKVLKAFIPNRQIEKTSAAYLEEKQKAQHAIDDKALEMLSTPAPASNTNAATAPAYDNTSRDGLNNIVNQRAP
jgi:membrane protein required for colicin V production